MRILLLLTLLAALAVISGGTSEAAEDVSPLIEQGNVAWEKRGPDGDMDNRAAADFYRAAVKASPFNYEAHWKAARSIWWIADQRLHASEDRDRQRDLGREGMDLAARAVLISPDSAEGHLYWALSALHYAYGIGVVAALKERVQEEAARHLMMCYEKDRTAEGGLALLGLSSLFRIAPWPIRDKERSLAYAREAFSADPSGVRAAVLLATALAEAGAPGESTELMKRASEMEGDPAREPDCAWWTRFARGCVNEGRVVDTQKIF